MPSVTVRLPEEPNQQADALADALGVSKSDVFRAALEYYVKAARTDPDLQAHLRAAIQRKQRVLEWLGA
jgi:predicted transcriptional regulator